MSFAAEKLYPNLLSVNTENLIISTTTVTSNILFASAEIEKPIDNFSNTYGRSAYYTITANADSNVHVSKIVVAHNDVTAYLTEYAIIYTNGSLVTYSVLYDSGTITLNATPVLVNTTFNIYRMSQT